MMEVWIIENANAAVWGCGFTTEALARAEVHHFFGGKYDKSKFNFRCVEIRDAITGDYAGMGANRLTVEHLKAESK